MRTTSSPSASRPTAAGCWSPATPSGCASRAPTSCRRSTPRARRSRSRTTWAPRTSSSPSPPTLGEVDGVFPLLHGPWGEDGTIQGMLEMAGVRYVGAGVLASAVSMDKAYMKVVLAAAGLPVMPSVTVTAREWYRDPDRVAHRVAELGFPLFVKPARGGSSIGISKVHHPGELADAIEEAHRHDPKALIEVAAEGAREIECGVRQAL